jgi:hypothetical protein
MAPAPIAGGNLGRAVTSPHRQLSEWLAAPDRTPQQSSQIALRHHKRRQDRQPWRTIAHRRRCTVNAHLSRVRSLDAFERRPR